MFQPYDEAKKVDKIINALLLKYPIIKANNPQIHAYRTLIIQLEATTNILRHAVEEAELYNEKENK